MRVLHSVGERSPTLASPFGALIPSNGAAFAGLDGALAAEPMVVGDRLWLAFVNTDDTRRVDGAPRTPDVLRDFEVFVAWLRAAHVLDADRAASIQRRAVQQPAGASAALVEARRVRTALRALAERGPQLRGVRAEAVAEINRVLGRSAGTRRVEERPDGSFVRSFVPVGDAFAGLIIPVVDSAAEALMTGALAREPFFVVSRKTRGQRGSEQRRTRRWCEMATCGNRAKAARHREKLRTTS